ncbi:perlucin-like protein [Strongylocentrotus purpuratus]|uniref:C-type lectin domain-containing protein n=1 Tax=Strongylocentrotus purpuratus TaxID=7668 RepID=A0A7M7P6J2_STRPU|nr:perlucin-like protein [Strongylocentrotus purpuratus]
MSTRNFKLLSPPNIIFVGLMILTIWTSFLQSADYTCPSGWLLFSSSCYFIDLEDRTRPGASAACQVYGASLAEITSAEENSYIGDLAAASDTALWIDCRDDISEGDWLCGDDNHPITYTGWGPGEPNNIDNEDCAVLYSGWWYDIPCTATVPSVCKKDGIGNAVPSSRSMTFKKDVSNPGCLRNNVIEQIEQSTLISCGGRCLQSADCSSINYYPHRERCDLNSATKAEANDSDFIEFFHCEYYDILS